MPERVPFVKMHGLGNDYVYLDDRQIEITEAPIWAAPLADRYRGIGGDGLIVLRQDPEFPCRMEMYNADGSRAEMCGNGIRCVARLAFERGYSQGEKRFSVQTDHGPRAVEVHTGADNLSVTVRMGAAQISEEVVLTTTQGDFRGHVVDVGNPHFIIERQEALETLPLEKWGPPLEVHPHFPQRANIEFVRVLAPDQLDFRVWERGSGETQACGTGATAAVAALAHAGRIQSRATVHLLGGDLDIEIVPGDCLMTGPATLTFDGSFQKEWLAAELAGRR